MSNNSVYKILLPALITVVILVAPFSVGGKHAQAQSASQTVADLLDGVSIPGLDSLPVSNVQIENNYTSADITVHGLAATVMVFKRPGGTKPFVSVMIGNFSPTILIPGSENTPLKDVDIHSLSFLYNPTGKTVSTEDGGYPSVVGDWLSNAGSGVLIKPGLNIYGRMIVHPKGEMADLLGNVGITDFSLPLRGGFSPSIFKTGQSLTAIKNAILDALDIQVMLPALSVPGLSDTITIKNGHLSIKGEKTGDTREIDVGVTGELVAKLWSKEIDFDFDIELAKAADAKADITITADSTSKVTLPYFHSLELESMDLTLTKQDGKWDTRVDAKSKLNNKEIDVTVQWDGSTSTTLINTKLTLNDLTPGGLSIPGLSEIEIDQVEIHKTTADLKMKFKGIPTNLIQFKRPGSTKPFVLVMIGNFSPTILIPGSENTPLKDVDIHSLSFLYNPTNKTESIGDGGYPTVVRNWLSNAGPGVLIKPGLNIYGRMIVHSQGDMADLLGNVGIKDFSLPLRGGFSPSIFKTGQSLTAIKNEIMDNLDLHLPLPPLKIPGIDKFVTFSSGSLTIKGKTPQGAEGIYIDFSGEAVFSGHGAVEVDVEYDRTSGAKSNFWVEVEGPINLGDIPGVNKIKHASHLTLTDLKISKHGIEAATTMSGKAMDIFVFDAEGWNAVLTQQDFSITEVISGLSDTPLKHITFPQATVVISENGINKHLGDLSPIAQDAFKVMFTNPGDFVQIVSGLTFMAGFHPDNAGAMKDAIKGIGIHSGIKIMGEIQGLFGGTPMIKLVGTLDSAGEAGNMPSSMKYSNTEKLEFFLTVLESGQDFDFELGIGVSIGAVIEGSHLVFQGKTKIQIMDEGFGIDVVASMIGTWKKPFNIPFSISNVTIEVGTQEDGALKMGFKGTTDINGKTYSVAGDGEFLPEALGAPQAIAFKASASEIDMFFLEEIAFSMAAMASGKAGVHLPISKIPQPKIKDAVFAFATPGAEDPDLGLVSEGFALAGKFEFLGQELGTVKAVLGPTSGISITGKLDDFDLGPLTLKNNEVDIKVPFNKVPSFHIHADLEFLDVKARFLIDAGAKSITLSVNDQFGPDFDADFELKLRGVDLNSGTYDKKTADFYVKGVFEAKIGDFIKESATTATNEVFKLLNTAFADGEKALKSARKVVEGLTKQINAERAKVRREKAAAEASVQHAENRVNSLNGDLTHAWSKYHHCHGFFKWLCKGKYLIEIGGLKASVKIADGVLDAVKSAIAHFPLDLDPRVAILIIARDAGIVVLDIALDALKGLDILDKFLKEVTNVIEDEIGKSINISKASFEGDLRGIIEHDAPVDLTLDADFFGVKIHEKFAFKLKDLAWDIEQLGLMGLYALEHIVDDALKDLPSALTHKVRSAIGGKIETAVTKRNNALAAAANSFSAERKLAAVTTYKDETAKATQKKIQYNQQAEKIRAKYNAEDAAYFKKVVAEERYNPLDHQGPSLTYSNDYFEIGHTGLCLTRENGEVVQHPCKGDKAAQQEWTTTPVLENGKDSGYVHLTQAGRCVSPEGKWVNVTEKFGADFTFTARNFQGDGKLSVGGCYDDKIYDWKILQHGTDWVRMVNRVTNHCIHFENSNAVPGMAKAVWGPCTGTANQVYRITDTLTPTYHKVGFALRNDFNSLCFGNGTPDVHMVECSEAARYDYLVDYRGYIKFVNTTTGKCLQPKNYTEGASLIEKECSQLDYQWWDIIHLPGGWSVKNVQTGHCDKVGQAIGDNAEQGPCANWCQAVLVPLLDAQSGFTLEDITMINFPAAGATYNVNFTPEQRKSNYDSWLHAKLSVKLSAEIKAQDIVSSQDWTQVLSKHKQKKCYKEPSQAYTQYLDRWQDTLDDIRGGTKCWKRTLVKKVVICPPGPPQEYKYFTKNGKYNPNYESDWEADRDTWARTYKDTNLALQKNGMNYMSCTPGSEVTLTIYEVPPDIGEFEVECPPPAPAQFVQDCAWEFDFWPPDKQKKYNDAIKKIQANISKLIQEKDTVKKVIPPPELEQYMCRVKYSHENKSNDSMFIETDSLLIGTVRNRKCVVATNMQDHEDYIRNNIKSFLTEEVYAAKAVVYTSDKYELVTEINGLTWVDAFGSMPQQAVAMGYVSGQWRYYHTTRTYGGEQHTGLQSIYACRVITDDGNTAVGWSISGRDCTYASRFNKTKTVFSGIYLLVRNKKDFVHVDLAPKAN